jgi:RNA polymerase sigma-70 factor (ECF subfamily)
MDTSDSEVARAVGGDTDALAQVMAAVRRVAVRYCRARLGRVGGAYTTADDVAQDVCEAVLHGLPRVRGPLLAFVYGIAAHKVADAVRAAQHDRARIASGAIPDRADQAASPEQNVISAERAALLWQLLDHLPVVQRETVVLRVMVGLTAEQVGVALGMSPGAVRVAQHRALARLRMLASGVLDEVNP